MPNSNDFTIPSPEPDETSPNDEVFTVEFSGEALLELKKLAQHFSIPETNLEKIIKKALKLLSLAATSSKDIVIIDKDKERLEVDIKKLE